MYEIQEENQIMGWIKEINFVSQINLPLTLQMLKGDLPAPRVYTPDHILIGTLPPFPSVDPGLSDV